MYICKTHNDKEEQTIGDLGFLDYGARMYDPALGRWHSINPKAEKYYSLTTYDFVGGNPILSIDQDGMDW